MSEQSCIYMIRQAYGTLSEKEKKIADFILKNPHDAVHPSIDELAELIGIAESTLVRFVRKLGYSGYQRFRIALATETMIPAERLYERPVGDQDDEVEIVFDSAIATLQMTKKSINRADFTRTAELLEKADRVLFFGLGGSGIVAQDAFHKFIRTGISCMNAGDYHLQLMLASQTTDKNTAILFSHTGANMDALTLAQEIRQTGCPLIIITSHPHSALARMATITIPVEVAGTTCVSEAFSARIAHLVIIDSLYVEVMKRLEKRGVDHLDAMRMVIAKRRM